LGREEEKKAENDHNCLLATEKKGGEILLETRSSRGMLRGLEVIDAGGKGAKGNYLASSMGNRITSTGSK